MRLVKRVGMVIAVVAAIAGGWLIWSSGGRPDKEVASSAVPDPPKFNEPRDALFTDDFSKSDLSRWQPDQEGVWTVVNGTLRAQLPDKKQQRSFLRAGEASWTDYAVDLDVCMMRGVDKGVAVRVQGDEGVGVDLRGPGYHDILLHRGFSRLAKASVRNPNRTWHHIRVEVRGSRYLVFVNGKRLIEAEESERRNGGIALAAYTGGGGQCTVYYDNVAVTRLEVEP